MIDIIKYLNNRVESLENNLRSAENALIEKDHQIETLSQFFASRAQKQFREYSIYKQKIASLESQNKQLREQLNSIKEILKS
jgi:prefoldin subunit 5